MSSLGDIINVICCGICENIFGGNDSKEERRALREPFFEPDDIPPQVVSMHRKKELKTENILGFGVKDISADYVFGDLLGEGAFGVVRRCQNKATGEWFACKTIEKRQLKRRADVEDIRREVQILLMLSSHPNVAGLSTIYEDPESVHLILELCEGGHVLDRLLSNGSVSEQYVARLFKQMVQVVDHCHTLGIVHRDIKPENFLLTENTSKGFIKAADFGLSQFFTDGREFKSLVGSAFYVAPEVLRRRYDPKADIWSLGVCLYVMLTGSPPFTGGTEEEIFDKILYDVPDFEKKPWGSISKPAKDLAKKMLQQDPMKRPNTKELLQHRWLCEFAPDKELDPIVLRRLLGFAEMTRVKHEALVAATIALEAGASPFMLDLVMAESRTRERKLTSEDVLELLKAHGGSMGDASDSMCEALAKYSAVQIGSLSVQDCVATALGRSEARREEFVRRLYQEVDDSLKNQTTLSTFRKVLAAYGSSEDDMEDTSIEPSEINAISWWLSQNRTTVQKSAGFATA